MTDYDTTTAVTAVIVADPDVAGTTAAASLGSATFCGLGLGERLARAAACAGIARVLWVGQAPPAAPVRARVDLDGAALDWIPDARPFERVPRGHTAVVLPVGAILDPAAITRLLERSRASRSDAVVAAAPHPPAQPGAGSATASDTGLAVPCVLSPAAVETVRQVDCVSSGLRLLALQGRLAPVDLAPRAWARLDRPNDIPRMERAYIRRLNDSDEFAMTKVLRHQSVHMTRWFLRTGLSPNRITLLGLAVSVAAAWGLASPGYGLPLAGALLYYLSTLIDCCDGEVARCSYRTSAFGCWLETWSDYASTLLVMAAVFTQPLVAPRHALDRQAAWAAIGGTLAIIAILAAQRFWASRSDPDAYERLFKGQFAGGDKSALRRLMVWGLQYLKRAVMAHVILALAVVGQLQAVVYLWAFATITALPFVIAAQFMWGRRAPRAPEGATGSASLALGQAGRS